MMGSDNDGKTRTNVPILTVLFAFLMGCVTTLLRQRIAATECVVSLGSFLGNDYTNPIGGTVGHPKCLVESKFLKVQQHAVQFPDALSNGKALPLIEDWIWIDYHDRINVLVEARRGDEPHFFVFRQTKYALEGRSSLAIVGGIVEPGEEPAEAARREVQEEISHKCQNFEFLGRYRTDVNRGMGWTNAYLAKDCTGNVETKSEQQSSSEQEVGAADTERQDLMTMSLAEIETAVQKGYFLEIQWTATVALAMLHYKAR